MTALTIIPDYGKKRLKLVGTVAAGEHVSVRVIGGAEWIRPGEDAEDQTLRLRVLFGGYTVAMFPRPEQPDADPSEPTDEWSEDPEDPSDAACELNLNSIPAEKLLRCGGECLCILDDPVNHTMYGAGEFRVEPWPKMRPADEPYSLDNYPDFVQEAKDAIAAAQSAIEGALDEASGIVAQAQSAKTVATDAATAATGSANTASGSANLAAGSAAAAAASASTATFAAEAAEAARDAIQPPVNPLTEEEVEDGRAADAASTGEALNAISNSVGQNATNIAKNADDIETAVGLLRSHASGATEVAGNLIHVSKQDRLNWNAKVDPAAVMQFVDGAAFGTGDYKNILYLKHGDTVVAQVNMARFAIDGMVDDVGIDDGNLVITFNTEAGKQPISIPLTDIFNPDNYYDKDAVDGLLDDKQDKLTFDNAPTAGSNNSVKSDGIWSAIWGALSALPTGFTSLYDWCVSQLAGKATKADAALTERKFSAWELDYSGASTPGPVDNKIEWNGYVWIAALQRVCGASKSDLAAYTTVTWAPGEWGSGTTSELVGTWTGDHWEPSITEYDGYPLVIFGGRDDATPAQEMTGGVAGTGSTGPNALELQIDVALTWPNSGGFGTVVATRTALHGYQLGSQSNKPLASEAEAEALRTGKQDALTAQQLANIAAVSDALAFDATHTYAAGDPVVYNGTLYTFTAAHTGAWTGSDVSAVDIIARLAGKLDKSGGTMTGSLTFEDGHAAGVLFNRSGGYTSKILYDGAGDTLEVLTADGNGTVVSDIVIPTTGYGILALTADIPYSLGTPIVIDAASSEVVEGETVNYGEATLANRTANIVQVTAATALDELRVTFPASVSGKVRDFGLRVEIGTGSAALAAPALVPVAPSGETITLENADGAIPALADGTAMAKGVTLLYFSETAPGVFVVKGEQVKAIPQSNS